MALTDMRETGFRGLPTVAAAVVWSLAAGSAALWTLQLPRSEGVMAADTLAQPAPAALPGPDLAGVARALGHVGKAAAYEQRSFELLGVIAGPAGQGSALLAVDGQPPGAFVQGQAVADGWRLQFVGRETVRLLSGQDDALLELSLPGVDSRSSRE